MNLFERLKRHWLGGALALAAICSSTTWFAVNEILVRPRDFEMAKQAKENSNLREEVRELKVRLTSSKEADLQEEVRNLKIQIENSNKQVIDLQAKLTDSNKQVDTFQRQITSLTKQENELKSQVSNLNEEIQQEKGKSKYADIFCSGSVYPIDMEKVRLGDNISVMQSTFSSQNIRLTKSFVSVKLTSGPFRDVTFFHDESGYDPKITFIKYYFRDIFARERIRKQAFCVFGQNLVIKKVQDKILEWKNFLGFDIEIDDDGYQLKETRR